MPYTVGPNESISFFKRLLTAGAKESAKTDEKTSPWPNIHIEGMIYSGIVHAFDVVALTFSHHVHSIESVQAPKTGAGANVHRPNIEKNKKRR